jgi:hypothetical protein
MNTREIKASSFSRLATVFSLAILAIFAAAMFGFKTSAAQDPGPPPCAINHTCH